MKDQKHTAPKLQNITAVFPLETQKVFLETYGCQMNVNDSEVAIAILKEHGFSYTTDMHEADLILINTCSIRENAELRVKARLNIFRMLKKRKPGLLIGVIGCMAERLKEQLLVAIGTNHQVNRFFIYQKLFL